jgi:hypothetical protein
MEKKSHEVKAFVFDLLGNSSVRFEQFDGTASLPYKSEGKFHLGGKIVITPLDTFKRIVENVLPIIRAKGTKPAVIIPPLPRHLFARCCSDPDHCNNVGETSFQKDLLQGFVHLPTNLIRLLVTQGITNFKVMDSCCMTKCATTADTEERIKNLRRVTAKDGVHFVDEGYRTLAKG